MLTAADPSAGMCTRPVIVARALGDESARRCREQFVQRQLGQRGPVVRSAVAAHAQVDHRDTGVVDQVAQGQRQFALRVRDQHHIGDAHRHQGDARRNRDRTARRARVAV